jgi:hypothetical protein
MFWLFLLNFMEVLMNRFYSVIKSFNKVIKLTLFFTAALSLQNIYSQSTIHFANKNIFLSGMNVAWVNYAGDIGPNPPDLISFNTIFKTIRQNGGNALRFWLHTDGSQTPAFDSNGYVSGPGTNTIQYLQEILNAAAQNHVGLQLCLWGFGMLNTTLTAAQLAENTKLLIDTSYTNTYIRNCLIPMVQAVKGNPAVLSWEVFNEPEGMSNEFGWSGINHVPMAIIQRVCNLVAGAIHKTDPNAIVTNGSVSLSTNTDVTALSKVSAAEAINSLSASQKQQITVEFNSKHKTAFTTDDYIAYILKLAISSNSNYYRDDRLIDAGGDSLGTLDFYNIHFYTNGSSTELTSPLNHPCSTWALTKPLVIAEFYDEDTYGVSHSSIYENLFLNGYAGALSWSWTQSTSSGVPISVTQTYPLQNMMTMFDKHRPEVQIYPVTGSIYSFSVDAPTIQKSDSTKIRWDVEPGSTVTLNGINVPVQDSQIVHPAVTTSYTLKATGTIDSTWALTVNVLPTGRIMTFEAIPTTIGKGEPASIIWQVVKNSKVKLNGITEPVQDTLVVYPDSLNYTYSLVTDGDESDSEAISIQILPVNLVDRALGGIVTASSNDTVNDPYSSPSLIVDGSIFDSWLAATKGAEWVQIDMGRIIEINTVIIYWNSGGYAKWYSLEASDDTTAWTTLKSTLNGTGGTANVETLSSLNGEGRYIKLLLTLAGQNAYSIREIEVFGTLKVTSVKSGNSSLPAKYALYQNYPNPFNPSTNIQIDIPKAGETSIIVYNILGQKVAELLNRQLDAGTYTVSFNASGFSSGIYFYNMKSGNFVTTKKMIYLK